MPIREDVNYHYASYVTAIYDYILGTTRAGVSADTQGARGGRKGACLAGRPGASGSDTPCPRLLVTLPLFGLSANGAREFCGWVVRIVRKRLSQQSWGPAPHRQDQIFRGRCLVAGSESTAGLPPGQVSPERAPPFRIGLLPTKGGTASTPRHLLWICR